MEEEPKRFLGRKRSLEAAAEDDQSRLREVGRTTGLGTRKESLTALGRRLRSLQRTTSALTAKRVRKQSRPGSWRRPLKPLAQRLVRVLRKVRAAVLRTEDEIKIDITRKRKLRRGGSSPVKGHGIEEKIVTEATGIGRAGTETGRTCSRKDCSKSIFPTRRRNGRGGRKGRRNADRWQQVPIKDLDGEEMPEFELVDKPGGHAEEEHRFDVKSRFGWYHVGLAGDWANVTPIKGDVMMIALPPGAVPEEEGVGALVVQKFYYLSDGSVSVEVKSLGGHPGSAAALLSKMFNRRTGTVHLCREEGRCQVEDGASLHLKEFELVDGRQFTANFMTSRGRQLLAQVVKEADDELRGLKDGAEGAAMERAAAPALAAEGEEGDAREEGRPQKRIICHRFAEKANGDQEPC